MAKTATLSIGLTVTELAKTINQLLPVNLPLSATKILDSDVELAASASDVAVDFGDIANAKFLVIKTDGTITAKINGSATPIPVADIFVANADNDDASGWITSLSLSNPNSTNKRLVRVLIGQE